MHGYGRSAKRIARGSEDVVLVSGASNFSAFFSDDHVA
jgi:hypothetical protein